MDGTALYQGVAAIFSSVLECWDSHMDTIQDVPSAAVEAAAPPRCRESEIVAPLSEGDLRRAVEK